MLLKFRLKDKKKMSLSPWLWAIVYQFAVCEQRLNAKVSDSGAECLTDTQSKPWTPRLGGPDLTGSTLQILPLITVESASPSNSAERMLTLGFSWTFFFFLMVIYLQVK